MPGTDPTQIAGYRIVRTLGRGGMSTVYLAQHLHLNRQVALKVLDPELADAGTFRARFAREAQIVAELDHPHIVPVYDAGEADGLLYLVMRYVENRDLRSLLPPGATLPHERVRTLVAQVAGALEVAHDAGLVHRDIKPANVLASTDRRGRDHFYLSDFGITKRTDGPPLTATGQVLGSADFIAPEQISGRPLDRRTDVYALGVLVYRCLTGHLPFERDNEVAVLLAHAREVPQPASSVRPELTPAIDAVLARVLSKDPGDRPATAQQFSDELGAALDAPSPFLDVPADDAPSADAPPVEAPSDDAPTRGTVAVPPPVVAPTDPTTVSPPPTDAPGSGASSREAPTSVAPSPALDGVSGDEAPASSAEASSTDRSAAAVAATGTTPADPTPAAIPSAGTCSDGTSDASASAGATRATSVPAEPMPTDAPAAESTPAERTSDTSTATDHAATDSSTEAMPADPSPAGPTPAEATVDGTPVLTEAAPASADGQPSTARTPAPTGPKDSRSTASAEPDDPPARPSPRPRGASAAAPTPPAPGAEAATTRHDTGAEPPTTPTGQPGQAGRPRPLLIGAPGQPAPVPEPSPDAPTTRTPTTGPPTRPVSRDRRAERRWAILLGLLSLLLILATVAVALLGAR